MRAKKLLSMLLVLVMLLSLFPMNAFALGGGRDIGIGSGFGRDIGDDEVREFDPTDYEAEGEDPVDYFQGLDEESGIQVTVESPFNALPTKAEVRLQPVDPDSVREAVASVVGDELNVLVAMDISFWIDGVEIEPDQPVKVKISAPELQGKQNLQVVHIPDGEDGEPETVEMIGDEDLSFALGANEVAFRADSFSVYAVIGSGEYTRATVNFISKGTNIGSMIVKPSDTLDELKDIVYDPGVGTLASGEQFLGWTLTEAYTAESQRMTISEVRQYLSEKEITDGETINFYAVIGKTVTLTFLDDKEIAIQADSAVLIGSATTVEITVNANAPAIDSEHNFEGWNVYSEAGNIVSAKDSTGKDVVAPYPNGTVLTLKGNVTLSVFAPLGHWLVFNENGKGATYCAPRFLESTEKTERPRPDEEMIRNGYTFVGWYEAVLDSEGKPVMQDGKVVLKDSPFVFGSTIGERVELFAKWTEKDSANYYVIIWRQNLAGDGYDFADSVTLSGKPGTTINTIVSNGSGNSAYATVNGQQYRGADDDDDNPYTGFHLREDENGVIDGIVYPKNSDDTDDKTIHAEGSTVVNIYYDRNEYVLNFQGYTYTATTSNNGTQYGLVDGQYVELTRHGSWGGSYYWTYNDGWIEEGPRYTGTRYTRSQGLATIKEIKALFGQDISSNFPIVGTNGVTYDHGERWKPQDNDMGWTEVMVYVDTMPHANVTFRYDDEGPSSPLTMNYYVEALPDDTNQVDAPATLYNVNNNNAVSTDKKFTLYKSVKAYYNFVTIEDIVSLSGFSILGTDSQKNGNSWISTGGTLNIYYSRDSYQIKYNDGAYVDGNGNPVSEPTQGDMGQSEMVLYGADISSYNKGGENYKNPTPPAGYVFEGWYLDDKGVKEVEFDKMPKDGIVVYAKWRQIQYRVFLHPNAGTDSTLDWGDEGRVDENGNPAPQQMNFRITYGGKISVPDGTRTGYKFLGWYRDPGYTQVFNADAFVLNDNTVTTPYDKTKDFTDPMDKWGNGATTNADVNRPWITRKFEVYARWSAVLVGADGIGILYDAGDGTNPPQDQTLYIDTAKAIAQAASTAPDGKEFKCWVVQTWDETEGKYVDTETTVEPGAEFEVLKANARQQERANHSPTSPSYSYTIQLRAEYKDKEVPTPSHIYWYANNGSTGDGSVQKDENVQINKGVDIPTQANWTPTTIDLGTNSSTNPTRAEGDSLPPALSNGNAVFLGWARVVQRDGKYFKDDNTTELTMTNNVLALTEDDLFLKWVDAKEETVNDETQTVAGYYQAKVNGVWTNVTQVACDEKNPYHDLYAVWGVAFYVYHTGTKQVERITIPATATRDADTFDLTELVDKSQFLYGGYYRSYSGATDGANFAASKLSWVTVSQASSILPTGTTSVSPDLGNRVASGRVSKATDSTGTTYTGEHPEMFSEAYSLENNDLPGSKITPQAGAVYYIKEVPANKFLLPKLRYTYVEGTGDIGASWLFTNTDDESYSQVGFMIDDPENASAEPKGYEATWKVQRVTIEALTTGKKMIYYVGAKPTDLDKNTSCTELFVNGTSMGYRLVYYNNKLYGEGSENNGPADAKFVDILKNGTTAYMYWVTPDGMIVTSTQIRTFVNIDNNYSINYRSGAPTEKASTIDVFTPPTSGN